MANGTWTYYLLRRDFRRCAFPLCGGYWIRRVNRTSTGCIDGSRQVECYVPEIDLGSARVTVSRDAMEGFILRGSIVAKVYDDYGSLGRLRATEVWAPGGTTSPTGVFVLVKATGIRCITAPCPTHHEEKLNSSLAAYTVAPDLTAAGAGPLKLARAEAALSGTDGIIVAGERISVRGPGGTLRGRVASQFYVRLRPKRKSRRVS